jgi:hypothetical protein
MINTTLKIPSFDSKEKYDNFQKTCGNNLKLQKMTILKDWDTIENMIIEPLRNPINKIMNLNISRKRNVVSGSMSETINFGLIKQDMKSNVFWSSLDDNHSYNNNNNNRDHANNNNEINKFHRNIKRNLKQFLINSSNHHNRQEIQSQKQSDHNNDDYDQKKLIKIQNTLSKMFYDNGHGLFIEIEDNEIKKFVPFLNEKFRNHRRNYQNHNSMWSIKPEKYCRGWWKEYTDQYQDNHHTDHCSDYDSSFIINDIILPLKHIEELMHNQLYILKDMFDSLCLKRKISNICFCIKLFHNNNNISSNNDDKVNLLPIFNFHSTNDHDILVPSKNDWLIATEKYFHGFENIFIHQEETKKKRIDIDNDKSSSLSNITITNVENIFDLINTETTTTTNTNTYNENKDIEKDEDDNTWLQKSNTIFWRGSSLSSGLNIHDNQRLSLCGIQRIKNFIQNKNDDDNDNNDNSTTTTTNKISKEKKLKSKLKSTLDVAITNIDCFERIVPSSQNILIVDFFNQHNFTDTNNDVDNNTNIDPKIINIDRYISITKNHHSLFHHKYHIHIDSGYKASHRYPLLLKNKSLIFKIKSEWRVWYSDFLNSGVDHLEINSNFNNLYSQYKWAEENVEQSLQIVKNAEYLYKKFMSESAILDFWQYLINLYSYSYFNQYNKKNKNKQFRSESNSLMTTNDTNVSVIKNFRSNFYTDEITPNYKFQQNQNQRSPSSFNNSFELMVMKVVPSPEKEKEKEESKPFNLNLMQENVLNQTSNIISRKKKRNKLLLFAENGNVIKNTLNKKQKQNILEYLPQDNINQRQRFNPKLILS